MANWKCLGCPAIIPTTQGSRCAACKERYRSSYSRHQWADAVKARDGYRCTVPGCQTPTDRVQADHIVGLAHGGNDAISNGRTYCHAHHVAKHTSGRGGRR